MNKHTYLTPTFRTRDVEWEERFLASLYPPDGGDMDIDDLDPGLWG